MMHRKAGQGRQSGAASGGSVDHISMWVFFATSLRREQVLRVSKYTFIRIEVPVLHLL